MVKYTLLYGLRFLIVLSIGAGLWLIGLVLFTKMIPSTPQPAISSTDGIVIFTGGGTRLKEALVLFEQEKGKYLLISGVNPESEISTLLSQNPLKNRITLGYEALDTLGNAEETAHWVHRNNIKSLILITSNYHMPRSLLELRHLVPNVGVLPHPVVGEAFLQPKWWLEPSTLRLVLQEYNKFLFALLRRTVEDIQSFFKAEEKS